jgi:hypothetical protein
MTVVRDSMLTKQAVRQQIIMLRDMLETAKKESPLLSTPLGHRLRAVENALNAYFGLMIDVLSEDERLSQSVAACTCPSLPEPPNDDCPLHGDDTDMEIQS